MSVPILFIAALHRSGSSLLHHALRQHPEIGGLSGTGVPEDEGQHLQSVYPPAAAFGGPGQFALNPKAYMDESHVLATLENAERILGEWSVHGDFTKRYFIEKSPPNIVRTRFLQALFPESRFVILLRHPVAVACATRKWSRAGLPSLLENTLRAYERVLADMGDLERAHVVRYEEFVAQPQTVLDSIYRFLGLASFPAGIEVWGDSNSNYFDSWAVHRGLLRHQLFERLPYGLEQRSNRCGYSVRRLEELMPIPR